MSGSDPTPAGTNNSLYRVASGGAVVVGAFLLLGGFGHLQGIRVALEQAGSTPDRGSVVLLLPALILLATALINLALCRALWRGVAWSLNLGLLCNGLTTAYLAHLLARGVPGHPIGVFLALLACFVLLLGAIRAGLSWPAEAANAD